MPVPQIILNICARIARVLISPTHKKSWRHIPPGTFAGHYVKQLAVIAQSLYPNEWIRSRYNHLGKYAELYSPFGGIVATVIVEGEFYPENIFVLTPISLSREHQKLFEKELGDHAQVTFVVPK